jgi:hypothetical protein
VEGAEQLIPMRERAGNPRAEHPAHAIAERKIDPWCADPCVSTILVGPVRCGPATSPFMINASRRSCCAATEPPSTHTGGGRPETADSRRSWRRVDLRPADMGLRMGRGHARSSATISAGTAHAT